MTTALVGVSGTSFSFDEAFSYEIPEELSEQVLPGVRVIVPFGKGSRRRIGIVIGRLDLEGRELKSICSVIDKEPILSGEQLKMLIHLRETSLCTYYEALGALIPPGMGMSFQTRYRLTGKKPNQTDISGKAWELYLAAAQADREEFAAVLSADRTSADELVKGGYLEEEDIARQRVGNKTAQMVRLTEKYYSGREKLTSKQTEAARILEKESCASVKELCYLCGCTPQVIKNMVKAQVCELFEYEVMSVPETGEREDISQIVLNDAQQKAFDGISAMISEKKSASALLYGVTGSGKTPVFAKLIEFTLNMGRNVLMLIPEISLTPQTLNRFRSLFGETVAVMHSGLSLSERMNEYKRIRTGQCRIVVGTRSAVFAPLTDIGLVIMDEEGERSYVSEASPRYHARDAAAQRCLYWSAVLLLASATPSIESFYSAVSGRTRLFEMPERYRADPNEKPSMPEVHIIDMTGSGRVLSSELVSEMEDNLARGEQSLLLLNRRGYHTHVTCPSCRQTHCCPQCSVPLTYHKVNGQLICHYCGYSIPFSDRCPYCGGGGMRLSGMGTQRLEDELSEFFPHARILRMDADTTFSRYAYDKRFSAFGRGEYDIMVGTQMIAKGLDFPKVTLVGVLNADKSLFAGDFRSYERTFSLITQVVGRSGRGSLHGRAYIQTYVPDHYVINLAAEQDYRAFYEQEISIRRALIYPPFCDICSVCFTGTDDKRVSGAAEFFAKKLSEDAEKVTEKMPLRILGPAKCNVERIAGRFRYRIILKCKSNRVFRSFIGELRRNTAGLPLFRGITVTIDMNGDIS